MSLAPYECQVLAAWLDYNGHMNVASYLKVFDVATDHVFAQLGIGPEYVEEAKSSLFAVEQHLVYDRELREGDKVAVRASMLEVTDKKLHIIMTMHNLDGAYQAASCEHLFVHVDMVTRRAVSWGNDIRARLQSYVEPVVDNALKSRINRAIQVQR